MLIVALALSLLLPCAAMANSIPVAKVDFLAVYTAMPQPPQPLNDNWTVLKNKYGYGAPVWESQTGGAFDTIAIDNVEVRHWVKHIWLEIDFLGPVQPPVVTGVAHYNHPVHSIPLPAPDITFKQEGNIWGVTWHWVVPQPDEEKLFFEPGDESFYRLNYQGVGIARIEVATLCVPLPAAVYPGALLMVGAIGITAWRRYRV